MTSWVCIDANVAVKFYFNEELSELADALWTDLREQQVRFVAPSLARYEMASVARQKIHRGIVDPDEGREALEAMLMLPIKYVELDDLHLRAYDLAQRLNVPTAYDTSYIIVAQDYDCEFWTADRKLVNAARTAFPQVKFLGNYSPPEDASPTT